MVRGEAGMECRRGSCGEENCFPFICEEVEVMCEGGERVERDALFRRVL